MFFAIVFAHPEVMLGWEDLGKVVDLDFLREGMKRQRAGTASKL